MEEMYLIETLEHNRSNGTLRMWWSPHRLGYTYDVVGAGLYSKSEAEEICKKAAFDGRSRERMFPAVKVLAGTHGRLVMAVRMEGEE